MKRGPAWPMLSTGSLSAHPFMFNLFILLCIYYTYFNRPEILRFLKKITVSILYQINIIYYEWPL
jgi:hypothetical protein